MEPEFALWCIYHPRDVSPLTLAEAGALIPHIKHMEKLLNYIRRANPVGVGQTWDEIHRMGGKGVEEVMFRGIDTVVDNDEALKVAYKSAIEEYIFKEACEFGMRIKDFPIEVKLNVMRIYAMGHSETRKKIIDLVAKIYNFTW